MKIKSIDNQSWIELTQNPDDDWLSFCMTVSIDLGHSVFTGSNFNLCLLNLTKFFEDFSKFILDRQLTPKLEGTYNSYLSFSYQNEVVIVRFSLGDCFSGTIPIDYAMTGGFEITEASLLVIEREFKILLNKQQK